MVDDNTPFSPKYTSIVQVSVSMSAACAAAAGEEDYIAPVAYSQSNIPETTTTGYVNVEAERALSSLDNYTDVDISSNQRQGTFIQFIVHRKMGENLN